MSHRKQQIEAQLKRVISHVLARDLSDPRIEGMVSITRVDVSPDLHHALIYVSVLPDKYEKRTIQGLRHAAKHINSLAFKRMNIRRLPAFEFRLDDSLKKSEEVYGAIQRGMQQTGPDDTAPPTDPQDTPPPQGEDQPA